MRRSGPEELSELRPGLVVGQIPGLRQSPQQPLAVLKTQGEGGRPRDAELAALVGERLRHLREQADLSLEQLSRRSRVSRGMLSQIELGRSVPTVTVLSRIASAFELPVSVFLTPENDHRVQLLKRDEATVLRSADGKFISRALFPFRGARKTEFYELSLQPGCDHRSAAHAAGTTENLVIASGSAEIEVAGDTHALAAGDALHFAADVPHCYRNRSSGPATGYLVMGYAQSVTY